MKQYIIRLCALTIFSVVFFQADGVSAPEESAFHVIIQPLGSVEQKYLDRAADGIRSLYNASITIAAKRPLPKEAYYAPNKRYRAEKLLNYLRETTIVTQSNGLRTVVLGLTEVDISTTKGSFEDWGILGLSSLDGGPAVVSTRRMKNVKNETLIMQRLVKVVNHELGHTFGLGHCPAEGCLMQDAKGTVRTVDGESGKLCGNCQRAMGIYYKTGN